MKSRSLHAAAAIALSIVACKTGGGTGGAAAGSSVSIDPQAKVGELDGQPITWGDVQKDKDQGTKVRQAESQALTDLYDKRRQAVEEIITRRLLDTEAKAKGKPVDQWLQTDFMNTVPDPSEAQVKAFYEQNKQQIDQQTGGAPYDAIKDRLKQVTKNQTARDQMGKMLDDLKKKHGAKVALDAPDLPRIEVEAKGPAQGPAAAKVTIVEFSDFQCPYCGREAPVIHKLLDEYKDQVRLVFRHYPLSFHPMAQKAAEAGACAADQNKFWEMHDKMFANQQKLEVPSLKGYAKELGLDPGKFDKCLDGNEKKQLVEDDFKAGTDAGVNGTPAFFVNGIFINGAVPYEQIKATVDRELVKKG